MSEKELPDGEFAYIKDIKNVNFDPHPFTIGVRHVNNAKHGILDEWALRSSPCAMRGCNLDYDQHTSDKVAFVIQRRNCTQTEMSDWLKSLVEWAEREGIDGFAFLETPEKYRIMEDEE